MIIRTKAFARAGLLGNPSDGYYGKTISFIIRDFRAEVVLFESPELQILANTRDHSSFGSLQDLATDVRKFGYYGGIRLLKATVKRFHDYCQDHGIVLDNRNFTLRYDTNIPSQVGMAGSSAIITACLRALLAFYGVTIPPFIQPGLILSVETQELGIPAGLQDRVVQVYEGMVYMDFDKDLMNRQGYGRYEPLDLTHLPPLYAAYRTDLAEGTEVFHNDIRGRFNRGEKEVVDAMQVWANLAEQGRAALEAGDWDGLGTLINQNFDQRRKIYRISEDNLKLVETARATGASAKFTGSGGAIVGTYPNEETFVALQHALNPLGVHILKPTILPPNAP